MGALVPYAGAEMRGAAAIRIAVWDAGKTVQPVVAQTSVRQSRKRRPVVEILREAAARQGIPLETLKGGRFTRQLRHARMAAIVAIVRERPDLGLSIAARILQIDPSTVRETLRASAAGDALVGGAQTQKKASALIARIRKAPPEPSRRSVKDIVAAVAAECGVPAAAVLGHNRSGALPLVRRAAAVLAALERPDMSLVTIGNLVNRDHTTVLHMLRQAGLHAVWQARRSPHYATGRA